jgi:hypothetical protein
MATREELLKDLRDAEQRSEDGGEPVPVLISDLTKLNFDDLPDGVPIQPVEKIDEKGVQYPGFNGTLMAGEDSSVLAYVEEHGWRKYWNAPLGVEEYHQLIRHAVEARKRSQGDVELLDVLDEDVLMGINFTIRLLQPNLRDALDHAQLVRSELVEAAEAVSAGVEDLFARTAKRLQGWGSDPLDALVDRMREGTAHQKGLTLEELTSRLFTMVPGFSATGHVSTETEEIDINIQNASEDGLWRRESFLLLAECKNWSGKAGKDEFVLFKNKLKNRTGRVSCGFLVSWNGFAETVTKEMLRGTKGNLLVVPITGSDLRAAVRDGDFAARLQKLHEDAVLL